MINGACQAWIYTHLLAKVLLFIVILEGEVCPLVFRLINVPINTRLISYLS